MAAHCLTTSRKQLRNGREGDGGDTGFNLWDAAPEASKRA